MPKAFHLNLAPPRFALWHAYDPASKTDLFSSALQLPDQRLLLIDPIELETEAEAELLQLGDPAAILLTNENHWRATSVWMRKFDLPVFAAAHFSEGKTQAVGELSKSFPDLAAVEVAGAIAGEIALFWPEDGGSLIVGDALIHFEPYGFTLLPKKYCQNEKEMRRSLRQLLELRFERLFFAHGLPILRDGSARLGALLNQ